MVPNRKFVAEIIKRQYKLRKLITRKKLNIPLSVAKKLVGPDCAYHLYWQVKTNKDIKE